MIRVDVAIVGAGPVGLFAVFACGQLGLRCAVLDALPDPGGQLTALYPEKPIYDIPGRPAVRAGQLVADLVQQAAAYDPVYWLGQRAMALAEDCDGTFRITGSAGETILARAIIIAAGVGAFGPNRPPLAGIEAYENRAVFYHVAQLERFRGRKLVIAGGGDSAVDWALSLTGVAAEVTVLHRRDDFRAHPASVAQMKADPRIRLLTPYQLAGLVGDGVTLSAIEVERIGGARERLEADCLLALFGLTGDLSSLASWGFDLDRKTIPVEPVTCATSRKGIYAIGDVATYPGKLKLILTGFAEAANAAREAYARVHPGKALHVEHSTSRGVPGFQALERAG